MRTLILAGMGLILLAVIIRTSLFTVDRTEFVYLTQFGRHVGTYDGGQDDEAGLHGKWPWPIQSVQRLDRRLQAFDLPAAELLTHDRRGQTIDRTLTLDAYVCWRVVEKDGVDRFIKTVGTPEQAQAIIGQRIGSELGAAIGQMELEELFSIEPNKVEKSREALRARLLKPWSGQDGVARDYGVEIVDIRLRRATHPPEVRQAIFERIKSERQKKVADYASKGDQLASDIESQTALKVREIGTRANAEAERIKGEADAEAYRIRNQAQSKDPEFYAFLKKLEEYQRILGDNKTLLLLSSHREMFDLLFQPPRPSGAVPGNGVNGRETDKSAGSAKPNGDKKP
ncbi:MAG: protease modulator HflC [Gemmataceae bacterium]